MTIGHPKPTRADRSRKPRARKAKPNLKDYYEFVAKRPCVVRGCAEPASLHHLPNVPSLKTGQPMPRRKAHALAAVVPLCARHHQGQYGVHALGETAFEDHHGMRDGHLVWMSLALAAAFICGGEA